VALQKTRSATATATISLILPWFFSRKARISRMTVKDELQALSRTEGENK
jgi:hypothetical protein